MMCQRENGWQGFKDPLRFDPDRFSPERQEDIKFQKNYLTFGHGPHYCVGREYATNHLTAFLAILSTRLDPCQVCQRVLTRISLQPCLHSLLMISRFSIAISCIGH